MEKSILNGKLNYNYLIALKSEEWCHLFKRCVIFWYGLSRFITLNEMIHLPKIGCIRYKYKIEKADPQYFL